MSKSKLKLTMEGRAYLTSLSTCLKWLALGGQIELKSGHKLEMTEDGHIGFAYTSYNAATKERAEGIMQCDSDVALLSLISHARKMTTEEVLIMQANLALNSALTRK